MKLCLFVYSCACMRILCCLFVWRCETRYVETNLLSLSRQSINLQSIITPVHQLVHLIRSPGISSFIKRTIQRIENITNKNSVEEAEEAKKTTKKRTTTARTKWTEKEHCISFSLESGSCNQSNFAEEILTWTNSVYFKSFLHTWILSRVRGIHLLPGCHHPSGASVTRRVCIVWANQ